MTSSYTYLKGVASACVTFAVFGGLLLFFKDDSGGKSFFLLTCLTTAFYAFYSRHDIAKKEIYRGILFGIAILFLLVLAVGTVKAMVSNAEWDYLCFYMQGKLGAYNLNFYDPHSFQTILANTQLDHSFSEAFKSEILDVGLLSPPVTMLFFAPLASLDYQTSKAIFSVLILLFIIIDVLLAHRIFFKKERSLHSLLFTFIIVALVPGTIDTIFFEQTNFFLLFFILLAIRNLDKTSAGIFLAISVIIKPITAIFLLYFLVHRKWKPAVGFVATGAALVGITAAIWGVNNITGFFTSPPTSRLPHYLYEQPLNQSIVALLNRNIKFAGVTQHMIDLLYYFLALVMVVMTVIISRKLSKRGPMVAFFPFILCMLMVYPSSLNHYMVCILPIMLYLLAQKEENLFYWISLAVAFSFLYSEVFFSYLVLFVVLSWLGWSHSGEKPSTRKSTFSVGFKEVNELISQ